MANNKIFIGWSGETNRQIAEYVKHDLGRGRFDVTIGGEWRKAFNVSSDIIDSMNECDYAIMLIEKEERTDESGKIISRGFNPNVMMELGYLLHKLKNACKVRRILINTNPNDLPSDLQGMWSTPINYLGGESSSGSADREEELKSAAEKIVTDFLNYIKNDPDADNKLDYFDDWEDNVREIYKFTGKTGISEKLIYGMQAAIYSGDMMRLYKKLLSIQDQLQKNDPFGDKAAVSCALAILNVFVVSKRLTVSPTEHQFYDLLEALKTEHEQPIKDETLKAWCKIFRTDKRELCCELYAEGLEDELEKIDYYEEALELCHQVLEMIDALLQKEAAEGYCPDEKYALLYKAFVARNVSQIHQRLALLEPEKAEEHIALQKEYCALTLSFRTELYEYYKGKSKEDSLSNIFISQEYLLALTEHLRFEEDPSKKRELTRTARSIYKQWEERNKIRNMVFDSVTKAGAGILTSKG